MSNARDIVKECICESVLDRMEIMQKVCEKRGNDISPQDIEGLWIYGLEIISKVTALRELEDKVWETK